MISIKNMKKYSEMHLSMNDFIQEFHPEYNNQLMGIFRIFTAEEFISEIKQVFGFKYEYSEIYVKENFLQKAHWHGNVTKKTPFCDESQKYNYFNVASISCFFLKKSVNKFKKEREELLKTYKQLGIKCGTKPFAGLMYQVNYRLNQGFGYDDIKYHSITINIKPIFYDYSTGDFLNNEESYFFANIFSPDKIKLKFMSKWTSLTIRSLGFLEHLDRDLEAISEKKAQQLLLKKLLLLDGNNEFIVNEFTSEELIYFYQYRHYMNNKLSLKQLRNISNKKMLLNKVLPVKLPSLLNKSSFLCQIAYAHILKIMPNKYHYNFVSKTIIHSDRVFYDFDDDIYGHRVTERAYLLISDWYHINFGMNLCTSELDCNYKLIVDYIDLCRQEKKPINLNMKSIKRLEREHDLIVAEINLREFNEKDRKLKIAKAFHDFNKLTSMELIETLSELYVEGKRQHHCVFAYQKNIENGFCAIFKYSHERNYTVEIGLNRKTKLLELWQCRSEFNKKAPPVVLESIFNELEKHNKNKEYK